MKQIRIQLDLPDFQVKAIEEICERLGIKTRREYFEQADFLMRWAIGKRANGGTIGSLGKNGELHEVTSSILENAAMTHSVNDVSATKPT